MRSIRKMADTLFLFAYLSLPILLTAQQQIKDESLRDLRKRHRCGTQYLLDKSYKKNPELRKKVTAEDARILNARLSQSATYQARMNATLTVPVVVHIILSNPSLVTDGQVQEQLNVLNADFGGKNADSTRIPAAFKSRFGKGRIQFCLAKRTPFGETTNGIVRVSSTTKSFPGPADPVKYANKGGSDAWDPTKYLNIWVCDDSTSEFLGYAYTPSIPLNSVPLEERGLVTQFQCFGKGGTATAPYNLGRTAVHEIGHFFNLQHIWGPTNCEPGGDDCTDDDGISDTPKQEGCNYGTPAASSIITDQCTTVSPGIMWMNYMDYVDDLAMVMFTPGQNAVMESTFSSVQWMQGLAASDGCIPTTPLERDVRLVKLNNNLTSDNSSFQYSCTNNFKPIITVRNLGTTLVTSLRIETKINNGTPSITNWSGTLMPNLETSITLNSIAVNPGLNPSLSIQVTLVNGLSDQNTLNNSFLGSGVIFPIVLNLPFSEGFELSTFPPNNWRLLNPDNDFTWERTNVAAKTGIGSMYFNNYNSQENNFADWMISPLLPAKGRDSIFVSFDVSAATYNNPSEIINATDSLQVWVSTDCASSFIRRYNKGGSSLVTTGDIGFTDFFTPTSSQWRKDSVFIGYYDINAPEYIQIAFKHITNFENNIYIDNVLIYNRLRNTQTSTNDFSLLSENEIKIFPNPMIGQITVDQKSNFKHTDFRLTNVFGQVIEEGILKDQKTTLDVSKLSPGVYFFQTKKSITKLIKN